MEQDCKRLIKLTAMAVGFAIALIASAGPVETASAEQRRVVVLKFKGEREPAQKARAVVVELLQDHYEVVPYSKYRVAKRRLNLRKKSMKALAKIARQIGADAVIFGELAGKKLKLRVREGSNGRLIDRVSIVIGRSGPSEQVREELTDELVDFIDSTDPIGSAPVEATPVEAPKATLATATQTESPSWAIDTVEKVDGGEKKDSKPSAVRMRAAVGVAGTARTLQFVFQPDLSEDERPISMAGAPATAAVLIGTLDILPLGVSAELGYERSIGANLSYPDGNQTRELPVSSAHLTGRIIAARNIGTRYGVKGNVGYGQLSYNIKNRPNGLSLPDSRYAYIEVGGGARMRFRDDRVALTGDVNYVHVLTSGGITAENAYGTARARGVRGEAGLEIQANDTTYVRLGVRATQITLQFHGNGALATGLDEDSDVDVSAASDTFIGGLALVGFHF